MELEEEPLLIDTGVKVVEEEKKVEFEADRIITEKASAGKEIQLSAD